MTSLLRAVAHGALLVVVVRLGLSVTGQPAVAAWAAIVAGALAGGAARGLVAGAVVALAAVAVDPQARAALAGLGGGDGGAAALPWLAACGLACLAAALAGAVGAEPAADEGDGAEPSAARRARELERRIAAGRVDEAVASAMELGRPRTAHDVLVKARRADDARALLRHAGLTPDRAAPAPAADEALFEIGSGAAGDAGEER